MLSSLGLELWPLEWRIASYISSRTAVLYSQAAGRVQNNVPVEFLGHPIEWIKLDGVRLPWDDHLCTAYLSADYKQVRIMAAQRLGVLCFHLTGERPVTEKRCAAVQAVHSAYGKVLASVLEFRCAQACPEG
jgi:hypothetical protein